MAFTRTVRSLGVAVLTGALILIAAPATFADQTRRNQWPLEAMQAESVWKITKGQGVTVAVIDTGVNAEHQDLRRNVLRGKDFADNDNDASPEGASGADNHGTGMASLIAGHGHGPGAADGVMGLAPEAKILPIRWDIDGEGGFADEIRYAVDHGASVINMSVTNSQEFSGDREAVAYALEHDVLIVAGSGNDGSNHLVYPAKYPGVLTVGAVDNSGTIWRGSNYGPEVLLTAPGIHIVSAGGQSNRLRDGSGTSDATALTSAAAALLRSKFPNLSAGQIANRLTKTAAMPEVAKGVSVPDEKYGYGVVQPLAALKRDIPAGPKYGPLTVPESLRGKPSDAASDAADSKAEQELADKKAVIAWTVVGLVGLAVAGLLVLLVVKLSRRNHKSGPGGSVDYPQYGRQPLPPQQNPYQQQPTQSQGPWPPQQ